jgi:OOP family OmpA-OmpF porin
VSKFLAGVVFLLATARLPHGYRALAQAVAIDRQLEWPQQGCPPRCPNATASEIIQSLTPSGLGGMTTRGIRLGVASAPGTLPSVAQSDMLFATGSATLTPRAMEILDTLGGALVSPELSAYRFRIVGHADSVGAPARNKALSDRRAAAVAAYLTSKFSIPAARLETFGVVDAEPAVPSPPGSPQPRDRRFEIIILGR